MINAPQLSMSIAKMEREILYVNVRLDQVVRQQFSRTSSGIISTCVNYFKTGLSFVGLTWLVIAN